jgi:hypothetical protein
LRRRLGDLLLLGHDLLDRLVVLFQGHGLCSGAAEGPLRILGI